MFSFLLLSVFILGGCTAKMVYLNTAKTAEEIQKDKDDCEAKIAVSDADNRSSKEKKLNRCMEEKGYKVVPENKAVEIQGFQRLWIKPGIDFKDYEAVFIDEVDTSSLRVKDGGLPGATVSKEEINNLGKEMFQRFSGVLGNVMPVISDRSAAEGKKVLYIVLKLNNLAQTDVGINTALEVAGHFSRLPMPGGSQGMSSFEAVIADFSNRERLIFVADESKEDKNASLAGLENFEKWKHSYNTMDYWADRFAALFAKVRGEKYKSRLKLKLIDF